MQFPFAYSELEVTDPLNWQFYNNSVRDWIIALAIAFGSFVVLVALRRLAGKRLLTLALHTVGAHQDADQLGVVLARRTPAWFLLIVALALGRIPLALPPRGEHWTDILITIGVFLQIALWGNVVVTYVVARYSTRRIQPEHEDAVGLPPAATVSALSIMVQFVFLALLTLLALDNLGVHITTLVAGLGISGVAIALAVQNILGDLFAALAIVLDKPFVVGDAIAVDAFSGTVQRIGLKTTRLLGASGEEVIFSNADLLKSRVRNLQRMRQRTVSLPLVLDGRTSPDRLAKAPDLIREVITAQPNVRFDHANLTVPTKGDVAVEVVYIIPTADYTAFLKTQQAITLGLFDRLPKEGIRLV